MTKRFQLHTRLWLWFPLALLLSACPFEDRFITSVEVSHPIVTVSTYEAAVGEFIEVTITNRLLPRSKAPEGPVEVGLALCFNPSWITGFDNCNVVAPYTRDYEPSEAFTIEPGESALERFTINIKRNQIHTLTHQLSFTANRPGTVILVGLFESFSESVPGGGGSVDHERAIVTFR